MNTKNKFYFYIYDTKEDKTQVENLCVKYNFICDNTHPWFSGDTELYIIDTIEKNVWGDNICSYANRISIEDINFLENIFIVLSSLTQFEYSKNTFHRDEDYRYINGKKLLTTREMLAQFLFKSKELVIIKDLITKKEYLITENKIIKC
jgi:hypothetical protein